MEELELFLASHQEICNVAVLMGNCGFERIEEIFKYTKLNKCYIVCFLAEKDIRPLEDKIRNDASRGLFRNLKLYLIIISKEWKKNGHFVR